MKTLIIENQYDVDAEIEALMHDNPETFDSEPMVLIGSLHRPAQELFEKFQECDALVIKSTFMYKDQLEDMAALLAQSEGKKLFIHRIKDSIEEWQEREIYFYEYEEFMANLKKIFENHTVYDWDEDPESSYSIKDEYWEGMRWPHKTGRAKFIFWEVQYENI